MSLVPSIQSLGPGRWVYMARTMADGLARVQAGAGLRNVPPGVLRAVEQFFEHVIQALEDRRPDQPEVSIAKYRIAADAVRATASRPEGSRKDLELEIRHCAEIFKALHDGADVPAEDLERLQRFFSSIAEAGESEEYQKFSEGSMGLQACLD